MSSVAQVFAGLARTAVLNPDGTISWQWLRGVNTLAQAAGSPAQSGTVPTTSHSPGGAGQIATDGAYIYVFNQATNTWSRAALSAF